MEARISIIRSDVSPQTRVVGSSTVLLTIIPTTDSSVSATITIAYSDAVRLNGTTMICHNGTLNIIVPDMTRSR